jgi:3-isopropylmalate dehydrogenase
MRARILLLPGDGVGPEVVAQGRRVLETVARTFGHELTLVEGLLGATAMDAVGRALPAETVAACRVCDAVLVGAVHGQAHEPAAVALRELCRRCDLHTSMVPMRYWSGLRYASPQRASALAGVDLMLVRDRAGVGGWGGDVDDAHRDAFRRADLTSDHRLLPVIRAGFRAAARRTGRLTAIDPVDPSLERRRWRALVARVAASWPDVAVERTDVEAATHRLRERPARWDVVLACGAGHDRLHRELAALTGSFGHHRRRHLRRVRAGPRRGGAYRRTRPRQPHGGAAVGGPVAAARPGTDRRGAGGGGRGGPHPGRRRPHGRSRRRPGALPRHPCLHRRRPPPPRFRRRRRRGLGKSTKATEKILYSL